MFQSARIRLTAWYLLIIMSVSILFSLVIYSGINDELRGVEQRETSMREQIDQAFPFIPDDQKPHFDTQPIQAARARLITTLGIINLIILVVSGGAGYFLAGRTLRPIQEIVDQLNRFISDASHELRTPITSLRSEMEVGLRSKNLTLPQAKKLIESNMEEVIHLQMLSDNLLELTQYETMNGRSSFAALSLKTITQEAIKNVQGQAKKRKINVENLVQNATLLGNADRLRELFTILLDNAVKYSKHDSTVKIEGAAKGNAAIVRIIDEGIGIDKKELPFIFERFYRADESRSIKGFGLGLSIAQKITDLHNGSIQVVSTRHKGTTFTVRLPLHRAS
jgi:signal transduction histidine kinase